MNEYEEEFIKELNDLCKKYNLKTIYDNKRDCNWLINEELDFQLSDDLSIYIEV